MRRRVSPSVSEMRWAAVTAATRSRAHCSLSAASGSVVAAVAMLTGGAAAHAAAVTDLLRAPFRHTKRRDDERFDATSARILPRQPSQQRSAAICNLATKAAGHEERDHKAVQRRHHFHRNLRHFGVRNALPVRVFDEVTHRLVHVLRILQAHHRLEEHLAAGVRLGLAVKKAFSNFLYVKSAAACWKK